MQRHSYRQSGSDLFFRRLWHCPQPDPRQILVGLQEICSSALDDLKQVIHRRDFLQLLGQEPLEKIDCDVVVLFSRKLDQSVDLVGDVDFLVQGQLDRVARSLELRFRRIDRRNRHASTSIDHIFDKPERVSFFFLGLLEKVLRQLRQRFGGEMRTDRIILKRSAEFIPNLLVDRVDNFLTR